MTETAPTINQEERGLAAFTHLSDLPATLSRSVA